MAMFNGTEVSGVNHPSAKLTFKQIGEIKGLMGQASAIALAKKYKVDKSTIYRHWKDKKREDNVLAYEEKKKGGLF